MPLFGGLFSKRDKKSSNGPTPSPDTSRASAVSEQDYESQWESVSQTTHSHHHESDIHSDATPVSSLLKLPFRRKASESPLTSLDQISVKRPSKLYGSSSDADVDALDDLRPPVKSTFREPNAFSTRSLPSSARTAPDASNYQDMLSDTSARKKVPKKSGLLAWARERTKSRPSSPPPIPVESFNLKAFRHIRPESPSPSIPQSECPPSSLSTQRPRRLSRPRGNSATSDASNNRISIAAFREAQARRSATNSPVPSFRPSTDTITNRALTPTRSVPVLNQTRPTSANRLSTARTLPVRVSSSSSSASSSSEEDSDEDNTLNAQDPRKQPVKQRVSARAQSDLGHGQSSDARKSTELRRPILPSSSHSAPVQKTKGGSPRSSVVAHDQPQAPVSNNASGSNEANKRSPTASSNTRVPPKKRRSSDSDSSSNYSSEVDSDDAPLATLVGPRRPGSAASSGSQLRSRIPPKPLIDINTLITDRSGFASPEPVINANKGKKKAEVEDSAGLAKLAALAREDEDRRATSPTPTINSLKVVAPQPQTIINRPLLRKLSRPNRHHRRSSSDIVMGSGDGELSTSVSIPPAVARSSVSPVRETTSSSVNATSLVRAPISPTRNSMVSPITSDPDDVDDDDIMPALRYMMPDAYDTEPAPAPPVVESPPSPGRVPDQERIVPTPIRERRPPSSFSVTSRPQHRPKQSSTSTITPATIAASIPPLPPSSPPPLKSPKTTSPSPPSASAGAAISKSSSPRSGRARSSSMLSLSMEQLVPPRNSSSPSPNLSLSSITRASPMSTSKSTPSLKSQSQSQSQSPSPSSKSIRPSALSRRSNSRSGISPPPATSSMSSADSLPQAMPPPSKPKSFITSAMRKSPASSTGDSSSGRVPLTPNESDFGDKADGKRGRPSGGLRQGGERKANLNRRSVSFEDEIDFGRGRDNGPAKERETVMDGEDRRRERRRSEAKASIELGNVINGRGPIDLDDEDDHNMLGHNMGGGVNQFNPMMGMGGPMGFPSGPGPPPGWNPWQQPGQPRMPPSQFSQDPNFMLAHQQAMMIAKQTYQMAVAQHALAVAGDEWERSSNASGLGGGSQIGGFSGGGPAALGGNMNMGMGMGMGMGMFEMGGGMGGYPGMPMPNGWPNGSLMVPPAARSVYGDFGSAQSDYSDSGRGEGWSSRTDYGGGSGNGGGGWSPRSARTESFGSSSRDRSSRGFTGGGLLAQHQHQQQKQQKQQQQTSFPSYKGDREFRHGGNEVNEYPTRVDGGSVGRNNRPGPRPRTLTAPSSTQVPAQHSSRLRDEPQLPPPSSWSRFQPGT